MILIEIKVLSYPDKARRMSVVARALGRYVFWVVGRPGRWGPFDDAGRTKWR